MKSQLVQTETPYLHFILNHGIDQLILALCHFNYLFYQSRPNLALQIGDSKLSARANVTCDQLTDCM
jgi:hypothetical protein